MFIKNKKVLYINKNIVYIYMNLRCIQIMFIMSEPLVYLEVQSYGKNKGRVYFELLKLRSLKQQLKFKLWSTQNKDDLI